GCPRTSFDVSTAMEAIMNRARLAFLTLFLSAAAAGTAPAQGRCDMAGIQAIAPKDAVIDSVRAIAAPVAHCEILGHIITQNPGPNRVDWSLTLPDQRFGGRYFFVGEGGGAGQIVTGSPANPSSPGRGAGSPMR